MDALQEMLHGHACKIMYIFELANDLIRSTAGVNS